MPILGLRNSSRWVEAKTFKFFRHFSGWCCHLKNTRQFCISFQFLDETNGKNMLKHVKTTNQFWYQNYIPKAGWENLKLRARMGTATSFRNASCKASMGHWQLAPFVQPRFHIALEGQRTFALKCAPAVWYKETALPHSHCHGLRDLRDCHGLLMFPWLVKITSLKPSACSSFNFLGTLGIGMFQVKSRWTYNLKHRASGVAL